MTYQQDRRGFLRASFKAAGQFLGELLVQAAANPRGRVHLRPPGAVPEAVFLLICTRCGDCAAACPRGAVRLLPAAAGAAAGTPYIDPAERACDLCGRCAAVCPTGALLAASGARQVRMGMAVVDPNLCWAHRGQVCDLCCQRCPLPDEAIKITAEKPQVDADLCTGCGLCVEACPASPPAVRILPAD